MWYLISCIAIIQPPVDLAQSGIQDTVFHLRITNIRAGEGMMMVAVFDKPEFFLTEHAVCLKRVAVEIPGELDIAITDLDEGTYAVSVFHDMNLNGVLDKNLLGVPAEPYGFSNNARGWMGPPKFADAAFTTGTRSHILEIALH